MLERNRIRLANALSWTMLAVGAVSLIVSVVYSSSVLAFIGLGLTFWGAVLLYIQNQQSLRGAPQPQPQREQIRIEQHNSTRILDFSSLPTLASLNQIVQDLGYKGDATYLPPKYFQTAETVKIYLSKQKDSKLPTPEQIQKYENKAIVRKAEGILLIPPGAELARVLEEKLGVSFTGVNLEGLQQKLSGLLRDLRIAENLKIQTVGREVRRKIAPYVSLIQVKEDAMLVEIVNSIYKDIYRNQERLLISSMIGAADVSAIAIAITKASGNPVRLEKVETAEAGKTLECYYRIIEEE
jgi:hypothetical protein